MDEKAKVQAQTQAPEKAAGPAPRPGSNRWLKAVIVVALVAVLGWGFALGFWYYRTEARREQAKSQAPQTTETAPVAGGTLAEPVEVQSALDAYKPYLKFSDVMAAIEDDLLEGDVPVVRGKLENTGNRTLTFVEVTAYFLNANGQRIHEKKFPIVGAPLNLMGEAPLRPGYIHQFAFKASDTPSEWAVGQVEMEVTAIRFGQ